MSSSNPIRETASQHSAVASSSLAEDRARIPEANAFTGVSLGPIAARAPAWAAAMGRVTNYVMSDCGGGQRVLKLAWVIDFQKLATIPLLAVFIARYLQHRHRCLDLFCDAEQLRARLDRQGFSLSQFQFSQAHHRWRRCRQLAYCSGLVLGNRLATHFGRRDAGIPASGLRLELLPPIL